MSDPGEPLRKRVREDVSPLAPAFARESAVTVFHPDPLVEDHWVYLLQQLAKEVEIKALPPLARILGLVRDAGCRSVVVEERYIDPDYRSEYSAFWSRRFDSSPDCARRVHFFTEQLDLATVYAAPPAPAYQGYMVLRPTPLGPVGRTVLRPPNGVANAKLTEINDEPTLFGNPLPIRGVPFTQQDGEYLRCAHAAAWISHYVAASRGIIARHLTSEIAEMPPTIFSRWRALPSSGLTSEQLQAIFSALQIPAIFYGVNDLPRVPGGLAENYRRDEKPPPRWRPRRRDDWRERILRAACVYLNSGFPVIVITRDHAFTLVGWQRSGDEIELVACDDAFGPYELISDPLEHRHSWQALMIPLPEKVFLSGAGAEARALRVLDAEAARARMEGKEPLLGSARLPRDAKRGGSFSVRAALMEGKTYKGELTAPPRSSELLELFRLAQLPHWVWVVELHDRARRARNEPCVIAEVVLGSTSHDLAPTVHLLATQTVAGDAQEWRRLRSLGQDTQPARATQAIDPWPTMIHQA